jgi:hypothetical protein
MSSEFGLVGVHERDLIRLMDENIANYNQSFTTFFTSIQSNNLSSAYVHK